MVITGKHINLRTVTTADAEFILSLRMDSGLNRYLSRVEGAIEEQQSWIESYKEREAAGSEYYFVIEDKRGSGSDWSGCTISRKTLSAGGAGS